MKYESDERGRLILTPKQNKCIIVVCCSILLFSVIYGIDFHSSLSQNGNTTKGVVIRVDKGRSSKARFDYEYIVNNKKYNNNIRLSCMPYKIELGDTIDIRYDSIKPNRSLPVDCALW